MVVTGQDHIERNLPLGVQAGKQRAYRRRFFRVFERVRAPQGLTRPVVRDRNGEVQTVEPIDPFFVED
ncbi:MAG: hypothetical protein OXQ92_05270 [Boseongicola sp.]|nr:hypothetical protein [Boseongicola sp.]